MFSNVSAEAGELILVSFSDWLSLEVWRKFRIGNSGKVSLGEEKRLLIRSIEIRAVNGPCEIRHKHPPAFQVQRQTNSFHQVIEENLRFGTRAWLHIHRCSIYCVAKRRIPAICPVHDLVLKIEIQINGLGQILVE